VCSWNPQFAITALWSLFIMGDTHLDISIARFADVQLVASTLRPVGNTVQRRTVTSLSRLLKSPAAANIMSADGNACVKASMQNCTGSSCDIRVLVGGKVKVTQ